MGRVPFRVLFHKGAAFFWVSQKGTPNLENYPRAKSGGYREREAAPR